MEISTRRPMITADVARDLSKANDPKMRAEELRDLVLDGIQQWTSKGARRLLLHLKDKPCRYGEEFSELVSEFKAAGYNVDWSGDEHVVWFEMTW